MEGGAICVRENGDGRQAQLATGTDDAQGNFAAIGDEDFAKHGTTG